MSQATLMLRYTKTAVVYITLGDDCSIKEVEITGDFFVYPEEAIEKFEEKLKGCNTPSCIERALAELKSTTVLGVDLEDLKHKLISVVLECQARYRGNST